MNTTRKLVDAFPLSEADYFYVGDLHEHPLREIENLKVQIPEKHFSWYFCLLFAEISCTGKYKTMMDAETSRCYAQNKLAEAKKIVQGLPTEDLRNEAYLALHGHAYDKFLETADLFCLEKLEVEEMGKELDVEYHRWYSEGVKTHTERIHCVICVLNKKQKSLTISPRG